MKTKHIFIFSISLLLSVSSIAQEETSLDSIVQKKDLSIRVGVNLMKPIISFIEDEASGIGLVLESNLYKDYSLFLEFGNEERTREEDYLNFATKGTYYKIGVHYNAYENWPGMRNEITMGLRYGMSSLDQTLISYTPNVYSNYFETALLEPNTRFTGLSANWIELAFGINVETMKNLFLGVSMSFNKMMGTDEPENFKNLYVPGFGRVYSNDAGFGINYTLSYSIPIIKNKDLPKNEEPEIPSNDNIE